MKKIPLFLLLTFIPAWLLFLAPLALPSMDAQQKALLTQGLWALAMWAPGAAALIVSLLVEKKPLSALGVTRLGVKRFYLWAWLLPIVLTLLGAFVALALGAAKLDLSFSLFQEAARSANLPVAALVAIQIAAAATFAPVINMLFTVGEELGWRGYLLPSLMPLGEWKAILWNGFIWGVWHAPVIAQGHNYPGYPILGIAMMIVFCILLGTILAWLTLSAKSVWVAALAHGAVNAIAGLPVLFFQPGFNVALSGTLASPTAWAGMAAFIFWLIKTKRLPTSAESG
ncbi:MAG: CPBP family intramembrane metalloprotease [Anaerolineales bacterium]